MNRSIREGLALIGAMLALVAAPPAGAAISSTPDTTLVTDGTVNAVARSADRIYFGGSFTRVGPRTGPWAALSASTGAADLAMPQVSGGAGEVRAMAPDGSGGFFIGGNFTHVGGLPRGNLAHIRADKSVDPAWAPSTDDTVRALAVSGSTVYFGGSFAGNNSVNGSVFRNRLAAVDATTGVETSWNPNANSTVLAMAVSGSTVYIGGAFNGATAINNNVPRDRLAAVSATGTGTATAWDPDAENQVNALAISGSTVYVGGLFSNINNGAQARNRLAAVSATGTGTATAWDPNSTAAVFALAVSGSTVYIGGAFNGAGAIDGKTRNRLAAVDATTGTATNWNPNLSGQVNALAVSGSTVYAGGLFSGANAINGNKTRNRLAAIDATTGTATDWDPNATSAVFALAVSGSTVYAGGSFLSLGGQTRNNVAALNAADGTLSSWDPNANGTVRALAVSGSTVYIGGGLGMINGNVPRNFAAAVDATTGTATGWNPDGGGQVFALAVSGSTVYMGGSFGDVNNGLTRHNAAAVDATTGMATGWDPNTNNPVNALVVSGSIVYLGGAFNGATAINGSTERNEAAAVDATTGTATDWNPNIVGAVNALALSGSTMYIGGQFEGPNSINTNKTRNRVAAVDATTGTVTNWDPNVSGTVRALAVSGSLVYIGGDFNGADSINNTVCCGGVTRNRLAAVDATTGLASGWNPDANGAVNALVADGGGGVVAGGAFTAVGPFLRVGVAAFSEAPVNTATPSISGSASVGRTVSCSPGGWLGSPPLSFSYQWLRDGAPIAGATAADYQVTSEDAEHALSCQVGASNFAGSASATSATVGIPAIFPLSVLKAGAGSVTSSPGGIDCGATCSATYDDGTNVTLTATPAAGSRFDGWSGDCSGTGSCVVAMTAARSVTATFSQIPSGIVDKAATLAKSTFTATAGGVVTLPIGNPNGVLAEGEVTLTTKVPVGKAVAAKRKTKNLRIGHKRFTVPAGGTARVKVKLSKAGRALLKKRKKLKVKARIVLRANGTSKATTRTITIKAPRNAKRR